MTDLQPGDSGYNEAFFGLSVALSEFFETDAVDLVDVHTLSPALARQVFETGILVLGDPAHAAALRSDLTAEPSDSRSPRKRFGDALRKIDDHVG